MDLKSPISTVVPSLDGPVLLVLARAEEGLSGRQIHKLAESGSVAGVRLVLQRLAATGLVHVDDLGNSLLYRLNRKHILAPIVDQLANLRSTLISRLAVVATSFVCLPSGCESWPNHICGLACTFCPLTKKVAWMFSASSFAITSAV